MTNFTTAPGPVGREFLSIPGPSVIPDRVLNAMHRPAPDIYGDQHGAMINSLFPDLCELAGTQGDVALYMGNGHAAWEASLVNMFSKGDRVLVVLTGRFARGWGQMAESLGIQVEYQDFGVSGTFDSDQVTKRLSEDSGHSIKAVMAVHTDTASSVRNNITELSKAISAADHPALLMVDCIASLGCEPFKMDEWSVDVMVAASQKGIMVPPGLAFVFVGERAWQVSESADLKTPYWNWQDRIKGEAFYLKFCGTPATHHVFGLRESLDMIQEEGLENRWRRHEVLAGAIWAAVDAWSASSDINLHIKESNLRSTAVTTITTAPGDADRIRDWCATVGVTLGVGLALDNITARYCDDIFRIGHMGYLNPPMLLGTLGCIDAALKATGIKHGSGALEAASAALALSD